MNKGWLELESDPGERGHVTAQRAGMGAGRGTARSGERALRDTRAAGPALGETAGTGQGGCRGQAGGVGCTGGLLGSGIWGA